MYSLLHYWLAVNLMTLLTIMDFYAEGSHQLCPTIKMGWWLCTSLLRCTDLSTRCLLQGQSAAVFTMYHFGFSAQNPGTILDKNEW
jgi:hypothetical protein